MPRRVLSVICPSCNRQYTTRCGLKKHLLKEHHLVFVENSDRTRSLTDTEYQDAILKRWKGQQHTERCLISVPSVPSQSMTRKRTVSCTQSVPPSSYRVATTPPTRVRNTHTPPRPVLDPVNNLSSAKWED